MACSGCPHKWATTKAEILIFQLFYSLNWIGFKHWNNYILPLLSCGPAVVAHISGPQQRVALQLLPSLSSVAASGHREAQKRGRQEVVCKFRNSEIKSIFTVRINSSPLLVALQRQETIHKFSD
jgi:hypothetical protein